MASRIQGITVEIGGDTTKLTDALKGVNSEIRNTQSQYDALQRENIETENALEDKEVLVEKHKNKNVPIWEKSNLTLTEAAEYFNIGEHKLREITNNHKCNFVLFIGTKRLIKRKEFEKYLEQVSAI